jgi:hypothetical protein
MVISEGRPERGNEKGRCEHHSALLRHGNYLGGNSRKTALGEPITPEVVEHERPNAQFE